MRIFDTNVQKLKYDVLREVARHAYEDTLQDAYLDIPKTCLLYTSFEEKPKNPKSNLASMGVYVFTWSVLKPVSYTHL